MLQPDHRDFIRLCRGLGTISWIQSFDLCQGPGMWEQDMGAPVFFILCAVSLMKTQWSGHNVIWTCAAEFSIFIYYSLLKIV